MPSDDELRRVAEDVRALARSLGRDLRAAFDRTRTDLYRPPDPGRPPEPGAGSPDASAYRTGGVGRRSAREDLRAARHDLRQAQLAVRQSFRGYRHGRYGGPAAGGEGAEGDDAGPGRGDTRIGPGPGCPPRWDNWGRHGPGDGGGVRPGGRHRPSRPAWSPGPGVGPGDDLRRPPVPAPAPAPPLRHRHDGSTLLGLLAVVFGLAWLAAGTHLAHLSAEAVVAVALMVLGAGTVVTARTDWALSRRSWPMLGGAALAVALLVSTTSPNLPVGFHHLEFGSRQIIPATWAEVPTTVHAGFGATVVDLSHLGPPPQPTTLSADSAAGRLQINVPDDLAVVVDAELSGGRIVIDGVATSGLGRTVHQVLHATASGAPLTLHVRDGFGTLVITTTSPATLAPDGVKVPSIPLPPGVAKGAG